MSDDGNRKDTQQKKSRSRKRSGKSVNNSNDQQTSNQNNKNSSGSNAGNKKNNSRNRNKKRNNNRSKQKRHNPVEFWGRPAAVPKKEDIDTETTDPMAIVRSLGRAPIAGTPAEPYFALIYDRAAALATVLGHIPDASRENPIDATPSEDDQLV